MKIKLDENLPLRLWEAFLREARFLISRDLNNHPDFRQKRCVHRGQASSAPRIGNQLVATKPDESLSPSLFTFRSHFAPFTTISITFL